MLIFLMSRKIESKMIEVIGLTKFYPNKNKKIIANASITINIGDAEVVALLGPNGAGKTTFIKQVVGLVKPDDGRIFVDGEELDHDKQRIRTKLAYVPQKPWMLSDLTINKALYLISRLNHKSRLEANKSLEGFVAHFELAAKKSRLIHQLSGGELRILNLGYASMGYAKYFFLDEPTNDLSPEMRKKFWEYVEWLKGAGKTIFLVTHNLLDIQQRVDRVVFMSNGKILLDGTPNDILERWGKEVTMVVDFGLSVPRSESRIFPDELFKDVKCARVGSTLRLIVKPEKVGSLINFLASRWEIENLSLFPSTLEDVYLELIDVQHNICTLNSEQTINEGLISL